MNRVASQSEDAAHALRRALSWVAWLNLGYFAIEFTAAHLIGSVSLFADSIDFLEDASVSGLTLLALRWLPRHRAAVGMLLSVILLVPGVATLHAAWVKFESFAAPSALPLSITALGALAINAFCAYLLVRVRHTGGSLSHAAFLSARNDVLANAAMIAAGALTALWRSAWPDLTVGLAILVMNIDAARQVYLAARGELASGGATAS